MVHVTRGTFCVASSQLRSSLPEDRRAALIATREESGARLRDIRLQGDGETVFLSFPGDGFMSAAERADLCLFAPDALRGLLGAGGASIGADPR
jgi:hypothetical protein